MVFLVSLNESEDVTAIRDLTVLAEYKNSYLAMAACCSGLPIDP